MSTIAYGKLYLTDFTFAVDSAEMIFALPSPFVRGTMYGKCIHIYGTTDSAEIFSRTAMSQKDGFVFYQTTLA